MNTDTASKNRLHAPRPLLILALTGAICAAGWSQLGGWARPARGGTVTRGAIDTPVQAGQRIDVAVHVDGATALAAWETSLRFDPRLVLPVAVRLGDFAPAGSALLQGATPSEGRLALGSYNAAGHAATGAGMLAVVTFEAVGTGQAEITLDPPTTSAFDYVGQPLPAEVGLRLPGGSIFLPKLDNGAE